MVLGERKDRSLPSPGINIGIIPLQAVDSEWLASHPDENRSSRVRDQSNSTGSLFRSDEDTTLNDVTEGLAFDFYGNEIEENIVGLTPDEEEDLYE